MFAGEWKLPIDDDTRLALAKIDWNKKDLSLKELMEAVIPGWKVARAAKK